MRRRLAVLAVPLALIAMWGAWSAQPDRANGPSPSGRSEVRAGRRPAAVQRTVFTPAPAVPAPDLSPPPDDPHDPQIQAWIALDHRVQDFLGTPLDPTVPPDATPDEEDAAIQQALEARMEALVGLEEELLAMAEDTSRPRRSLEATVTLGEVYADMGASVEQLPVPAGLGPRQAARWARQNDGRAAVHLDKARLLFDVATRNGGAGDPALAARIGRGSAAAAPR